MTIKTIYLARHGFRLSWVRRVGASPLPARCPANARSRLGQETTIWNAPTNTPRDPPLSAHGVDQAKELAMWFAALPAPERPQRIISSCVAFLVRELGAFRWS